MKVKVVTYLRTATKDEDTITRKVAELNELLERYKDQWEVVGHYRDYGYSGGQLNRPDLKRLFNDSKKKQFSLVVTIDTAVVARNILVLRKIEITLEKSNVSLFYKNFAKSNWNSEA